ncbi:adenylate/guanylate cyclase domain-containing protein [Lyngbya aestuarii]|uniref:adenylate/guanylate cyclase domain-containing protein n=1 Tax=Lyngbya aestuarii TaxID=118322 RepID=UPI00403D9EA3
MKVVLFGSIRTRMMAFTAFLILAIVGVVVWSWAEDMSDVYYNQKQQEAKMIVTALSNAWTNELVNQNWSQIRLSLNLLTQRNSQFIYILVSDARRSNQIVAASPEAFQEQYFPDLVPVEITKKALETYSYSRLQKTFILRDIEFPRDQMRSRRGERILEAAAGIRSATGEKIGNLRIGVSLKQVRSAVRRAIYKALLVGAFGLSFGLLGAYILALHLTKPVKRLQISAAKIAAGNWQHRVNIYRADEIGALATSFNEMSSALQAMFSRLEKTLDSFERFVPGKFLTVIASDGIENIQVGVAATRLITILFADIRGYTSMSEQMTPMETFTLLNDYLACMGQVINEAGGFIDKYIGDAIMALFENENSGCSLYAALAMQQRLKVFNEERQSKNQPIIKIGIGIHYGEVVMGTIGFTSRIESTVIGDAVNVAARVEGLTRIYDCGILVTEPVVSMLKEREAFHLRLVDDYVKVKGKKDSVAIYELLGA